MTSKASWPQREVLICVLWLELAGAPSPTCFIGQGQPSSCISQPTSQLLSPGSQQCPLGCPLVNLLVSSDPQLTFPLPVFTPPPQPNHTSLCSPLMTSRFTPVQPLHRSPPIFLHLSLCRLSLISNLPATREPVV